MSIREIIYFGEGVMRVSPRTYQKMSDMAFAGKSQREIFESIGASEVEIEYGRTHFVTIEIDWSIPSPE